MEWFFTGYWPWWLGGISLGVMTVALWVLERRVFGVSGFVVDVIDPVPGRDAWEAANAEAMEAALLEATLRQFGAEALEGADAAPPEPKAPQVRVAAAPPRGAHLAFLVMMIAGGAAASSLSGTFAPRFSLSGLAAETLGNGATAFLALLAGGMMIGFGTRMAGGCPSGHGLSGCSRLQGPSFLATAIFFGTGTLVSFGLEALLR